MASYYGIEEPSAELQVAVEAYRSNRKQQRKAEEAEEQLSAAIRNLPPGDGQRFSAITERLWQEEIENSDANG